MRIYSFFIKLVFDHDTRKLLVLYHKKPRRSGVLIYANSFSN